jgi:phosphoserine aminotransferase
MDLDSSAAYFYLTSNETIGGIQWKNWPETGNVPIVADMSSDILSRDIPFEKFGLIYAGAQKNLGPAGVCVVLIRDDVLDKCPDNLPAYLSYKIHAEKDSMYNTPPVFSIYAMKLVLDRMKKLGGLPYFVDQNNKKADLLYNAIDNSGGFYNNPVQRESRSLMNVVFKTPSEDLDAEFVREAAAQGLVGLKGHRSVGGCRASIYNGMTVEGTGVLADFMKEFSARKG